MYLGSSWTGDEALHLATPATDGAEITVAIAIENRDTTDSIQPADAADAKDDADDPENGIFVIEAIWTSSGWTIFKTLSSSFFRHCRYFLLHAYFLQG
ncbi:hypothetical protein CGMCC3_g18067 [Colletotrichum fructicola]|nr:uncharacterized protein CGMCC3_g18067 [Colletotrichum fructicola]KAE9565751.1 hypothetical protein CGMCC3_g18067 [Colletotrichum fructicola]